jgi:hypothetical protein
MRRGAEGEIEGGFAMGGKAKALMEAGMEFASLGWISFVRWFAEMISP